MKIIDFLTIKTNEDLKHNIKFSNNFIDYKTLQIFGHKLHCISFTGASISPKVDHIDAVGVSIAQH